MTERHPPVPDRLDADHLDELPTYLSHRQILVVLFGVMSGMLLAALDQSIVGVALPRITSELGGLDKLAWVVTAYLVTATAMTPLWGKISDLYGRRLIFQLAISIFLVGSLLSGLSQNIFQLIGFRALQGIGGGGLFAIAFAIIGDVIPPRERGRYQGYFGAVFGLASVAGPLLGGWFTDGPGWRWIFYVNLPVGIAALFITSSALKIPMVRREHSIDWLGAVTIVASVSSLLLYLDWRGKNFGWGDPVALALVGAAVVLALLFLLVEARAKEPIIPLHLFTNRTFGIGNIFGFLAGFAMFGAIIFLPVYLQTAQSMTPTESGLAMLPAVMGIFSASIVSGLLMTRTGRYKVFPVAGAIIIVVSLLLLSTITTTMPYWQLGLMMFLFGTGLGMTMQTIVTAIQNDVSMRDMGTATSATTFFRQLGGAIGTAVFGAVLTSRLTVYLAEMFAGSPLAGAGGAGGDIANNVQKIHALPEPIRSKVLDAFSAAIGDVFLVGAPFLVIAFVAALFLKEIPLKTAAHGRPTEPAPESATASSTS